MPKETVKAGDVNAWSEISQEEADERNVPKGRAGRKYHPGDEIKDGETLIAEPNLTVSWQKFETQITPDGGWVQVGLEIDTTALFERVDGMRKAEKGVEMPLNVGFYADTLTRGEINKMIRVLRRARDQAFGSDE